MASKRHHVLSPTYEYTDSPCGDRFKKALRGERIGYRFVAPCDYSKTGWAVWFKHAQPDMAACTCVPFPKCVRSFRARELF